MNSATIKNTVLLILSVTGSFLVDFTGGMDTVLKALLVFMAVDYLTGITVAFIFHKSKKTIGGRASSREGFKGIIKKLCMLLLVGLAHELDSIMKVDCIRSTTVMFFLVNEGLSVLENMGLMGIKYPAFFVKALEVLREKSETEESGGMKNGI